ncbi:hypothetical protein C0Q70_20384 [Pomacea canaliculata]|uniref:Uncharacterized protein n=1 Tax=Pomacea canaliculata TaxID=400727 RepID=A0A2T7NFE7_POMCA|nr:hypothetical protein C0Q70_20384 [Pomacea canaliculata]
MVAQFQTPGSRTWREGNIKSCFNYLLLDPRVTKNLPLRAKSLSLERLTNVKRGDYYGVASTWPATRRRAVGAFLLRKAYQIFLAEGERQICPVDIKNER